MSGSRGQAPEYADNADLMRPASAHSDRPLLHNVVMSALGLLDKLDAAFFTFSAFSAAWLAFLLLDRRRQKQAGRSCLLVVFWFFFTYLFLPRVHRILTRLYVPGLLHRPSADERRPARATRSIWPSSAPRPMSIRRWRRPAGREPTISTSGPGCASSPRRCGGRAIREAPVSPLHLFERQQDFAYQQEVAGSPSKRHHVRFWRCPGRLDAARAVTPSTGWLPGRTTARSGCRCSPCRSPTRSRRTPTSSATSS